MNEINLLSTHEETQKEIVKEIKNEKLENHLTLDMAYVITPEESNKYQNLNESRNQLQEVEINNVEIEQINRQGQENRFSGIPVGNVDNQEEDNQSKMSHEDM
ncbi:hypothetical protein JTB14_012593 [Gonioctena quinquepunctata]|nr:hypothetical protein JTB14_012593 [Gonioctena quinquepunctata]